MPRRNPVTAAGLLGQAAQHQTAGLVQPDVRAASSDRRSLTTGAAERLISWRTQGAAGQAPFRSGHAAGCGQLTGSVEVLMGAPGGGVKDSTARPGAILRSPKAEAGKVQDCLAGILSRRLVC